jgi:hypothetical protein
LTKDEKIIMNLKRYASFPFVIFIFIYNMIINSRFSVVKCSNVLIIIMVMVFILQRVSEFKGHIEDLAVAVREIMWLMMYLSLFVALFLIMKVLLVSFRILIACFSGVLELFCGSKEAFQQTDVL